MELWDIFIFISVSYLIICFHFFFNQNLIDLSIPTSYM